VHIDTIAQRHY